MSSRNWKGLEVCFTEYDIQNDMYNLLDYNYEIVGMLKRHEFLSQPELGQLGNAHGRYRPTYQTIHCSPTQKSGGSGPTRTIAVAYRSDGPAYTVEDAGVRAGEITAKRCWRVLYNDLYSVYMNYHRWFTDEPMIGDVGKGFGVHGFKRTSALHEYVAERLLVPEYAIAPRLAIGTVSLWGEVIEHDRGYRAQYAKVASIDSLYINDKPFDYNAALLNLRQKYGVE